MDELDAFYVQRPHAPLEPMKTYLRATKQHIKALFSGHRGSGKSTELRRLAKDVGHEFFVVQVSATDSLNIADLNYVDVVLACAAALFRETTDKARQVKIPSALWRGVLDLLTNEITAETTIKVPTSRSLGAKVNAFVFSIEGKYGKETETRQSLRKRLFPYINDLIQQANGVCQAIEEVTRRPPLIIFEDLDKPDSATARDLFFEHATTLNSLACRIIYTFPIALCYSDEFAGRIRDYSWHFLLPNVSLYNEKNTPNVEGRATLKTVVTKRISESTFSRGALDGIIELSGGLMRDLIRLVSEAALIALTEGSSVITSDIVQRVAAESANAYRRSLLPEHYDVLRDAHETKQITPSETVREVLANLSLLEYRNTIAWCDVHPIVRTLL
jgi:DNA polymerase III delta prime subunit